MKGRPLESLERLTTVSLDPAARAAQAELGSALGEMREALHRRGRMSSRNEALDELAKLLFAHTMGVQAGSGGISRALFDGAPGAAAALIDFVSAMVERHLPESLGHEFSSDDFALSLRPTEDQLAVELVAAFEAFSAGSAQMDETRFGSDLINDAFGQFLVDSFADEKELGQYLTPSEVVRFMVELAIDEMTEAERTALASPATFADFGLVMDPSCGVGSFLAEFVRTMHAEVVTTGAADAAPGWVRAASRDLVVGLDKSERMIRLALANLATFGATAARLHLGNSLAMTGPESETPTSMNGKVGLILTNPPFGATFMRDELAGYKIASDWGGSPASVDSELLFMERYLDWLRPGGQLLAVVPDSVLTNGRLFASLRAGLAPDVEIRSVISLPAVTFAAAGTFTKTSILHLRKTRAATTPVRFAICRDIGYSVTKRRKIHKSAGDLPEIRRALLSNDPKWVTTLPDLDEAGRWDASFHASPSRAALASAQAHVESVRVGDVATLSTERVNPKSFSTDTFQYIEIANVDGGRMAIDAKAVPSHDAPSRARALVRENDVLVSTVRPERGSVGVVPGRLDGAIASTGFGVLRPTAIHPMLLAALLRTNFVRDQFLKHNVGIAYPAIDSAILPEIILPIDQRLVSSLSAKAEAYHVAERAAETSRNELTSALLEAVDRWNEAMG